VVNNKWKKGFFLLAGIDLLFVILVLWMALSPAGDQSKSNVNQSNKRTVSFHVKSNKNDLNMLINHYLKEETADSPIAYRVILGNEVELYGTMPLFSEKINLKLTFEPTALPNGDLVLKQKSISIGKLRLPVSYVMNFINDNYKIPNGVDIRPNEKQIYVHMQQLRLKSDIRVKVDKFDLKKDDIAFTILVPVD
jgi:uncharacterized protein YpmS